MAERRIGIIVNGATGRMTRNQHLGNALVALRHDASAPIAAYSPLIHSPIWPATWHGARSGRPRDRRTIPPDHACSVNSVNGLPSHGLPSPHGVIAATTARG